MNSSGRSTCDNKTIHHKQLNGVPARLSAKVNIYFIIKNNQAIK